MVPGLSRTWQDLESLGGTWQDYLESGLGLARIQFRVSQFWVSLPVLIVNSLQLTFHWSVVSSDYHLYYTMISMVYNLISVVNNMISMTASHPPPCHPTRSHLLNLFIQLFPTRNIFNPQFTFCSYLPPLRFSNYSSPSVFVSLSSLPKSVIQIVFA